MKTLEHRIVTEMHRWMMSFEGSPKALYLGAEEYYELEHALRPFGFAMVGEIGRAEYRGALIYRVDAKNYLAVG